MKGTNTPGQALEQKVLLKYSIEPFQHADLIANQSFNIHGKHAGLGDLYIDTVRQHHIRIDGKREFL
jgi:hypothetical protein